MYQFLAKRCILKTLLFTFFCSTLTWASPELRKTKNTHFVWENTKLNFEFGWGALTIGTLSDNYYHNYLPRNISFNYNLKLLGGYTFPIASNKKLGFEVGLGYAFPRVANIPKFNITFKEDHLTIPILLTISKLYNISFYCEHSFIIGYEFNIILHSKYNQFGHYSELPVSMQGNKNSKEFISNFSRLSGSILIGNRFVFPKGVYLEFTSAMPIEMFKLLRVDFSNRQKQFDNIFVNYSRGVSANWIELIVGINIMDWIYPKEALGKRNS